MIWLQYGVDQGNKQVAIEDVTSGKTKLIYPCCSSALIAKEGSVKEHHLPTLTKPAIQSSSIEPRELPTLPLYDAFDIFLSGKELDVLKKLWHKHKSHNNGIHRLEILPVFTREKLLEYDQHLTTLNSCGGYQFTDLGKIPVRGAHLEVRGV